MNLTNLNLSNYAAWDGARYLQELIDNPQQDIYCTSLIHSLEAPDTAYFRSLAPEQENPHQDEYSLVQNFVTSSTPIPALDQTTILECKGRLKTLQTLLATKLHPATRAACEDEQHQIQSYLKAGLRRDLNPEPRRSYQIVQKAIKRFLQHLEKTQPELASFINAHLSLGIYCRWRG